MKKMTLAFILSLIILASSISVQAQIIVVGQNNPAVDIQAVQKAVDQGGTINLKGTFDFGEKGRVNIAKDVKIIGDLDSSGNPMTKVKQGYWSFYTNPPAQIPPSVPGPKITIHGIHFEGALWSPIHLTYSSGVIITKNKITNVRPLMMDQPLMGMAGVSMQQGIIIGPCLLQPLDKHGPLANVFVGFLRIEDNEIDVTNDNPTKTMGQGVFMLSTTGVIAQISRNTVYNASRNSIEVLECSLGEDGRGMFVIQDNKIISPQAGIPIPSPTTPNGIIGGWFFDPAGGVDPKRNPRYIVINNAIRTKGTTSVGIFVASDNAVISNNAVVAEGSDSRPIVYPASNGYIAHNKIEGVGNRAMQIIPMRGQPGSKNVLVKNDFSQFKASVCDVTFEKDSKNNLVSGSSGTVVDQGSGNQIEGLKSVTQ
jgi:hypothetical protein